MECHDCGEKPESVGPYVTRITGWTRIDGEWKCPTCLSRWTRFRWWIMRELSWFRMLFRAFTGKK